jgi:hypothetical protein
VLKYACWRQKRDVHDLNYLADRDFNLSGSTAWGAITNDIYAWQSRCWPAGGQRRTRRFAILLQQQRLRAPNEKSKGPRILLPPYCLIESQSIPAGGAERQWTYTSTITTSYSNQVRYLAQIPKIRYEQNLFPNPFAMHPDPQELAQMLRVTPNLALRFENPKYDSITY